MERVVSDRRVSVFGRMLFVAGVAMVGMLLLMAVPFSTRSSGVQGALPEGWQEVWLDTFSDGLGEGWQTFDVNDVDGKEYTWGIVNVASTSPITSVWSVGGGVDGSTLVASGTYTYPDSADSWLIYGPITITQAFEAELLFDWWLDSEPGDWFGWCVLDDLDGFQEGCEETRMYGHIGTWISTSYNLDLDPTGESFYIAFHFTSNDDGEVATGAFVDDVRLRADYGYHLMLPLVRIDPTPTPTPTPTPADLNYYDSFNNENSGWLTHTAECCLDMNTQCLYLWGQWPEYKYNLYYNAGRYHVYIPLDCRHEGVHGDTRHIYPVVHAPSVLRPNTPTCIEARGSFEVFENHVSSWGLVFASNQNASTHYTLWVNDQGDWGVRKVTGYGFPGPNHPFLYEERTEYSNPAAGHRPPARPAFELNTLEARVDGDRVELYINGQHVFFLEQPDISDLRYVGMYGGSWETTPVQIGFDYFSVDEGCDNY